MSRDEKNFLPLHITHLVFFLTLGVLMIFDYKYFQIINLEDFDFLLYGFFSSLLIVQFKFNFSFLYFFPFLVYFRPLSIEFGLYTMFSFLFLLLELLRLKKISDFRFFRNYFLGYFYGYITISRLLDSKWLHGNGVAFILESSMYGHSLFGNFFNLNSVPTYFLNYSALIGEGMIAFFFLIYRERYAFVLAIALHCALLFCTGLIVWHTFLIIYYLSSYFTVDNLGEKIIKRSFYEKVLDVYKRVFS